MIFRYLTVPQDSYEFYSVNKFLYCLLDKKASRRFCNFTKITKTEFFENFQWDDLINFRMKAPYIPEIKNYDNDILDCGKLYEEFNEENFIVNFF